jgi:hypothetical protein
MTASRFRLLTTGPADVTLFSDLYAKEHARAATSPGLDPSNPDTHCAVVVTWPALVCDSGSWLNSVDWLDLGASYHPTAAGQADGYLPAFSAAAAG